LGRAIASLLFETSPHDPTVLIILCGALLIVALLSSVVPAVRATGADPANALRAE